MPAHSILIVGAERGLGLGLAQTLRAQGWDVTGTARHGADTSEVSRVAKIAHVDVTLARDIQPLLASVGTFDVIFLVAGIYGPLHNSVVEATEAEPWARWTEPSAQRSASRKA